MGQRKQSKRQRKQKDRHSLKHKGQHHAELPDSALARWAAGAVAGSRVVPKLALSMRFVQAVAHEPPFSSMQH